MFGGAYSGTYSVQIRHTDFGLIDTDNLTFTVGSEVTSFTPSSGSIYGGTLITIEGSNWSKNKLDNPVSIVYNGALGATHCLVKTSSANKITCRLQEFEEGKEMEDNKQGKLLVFLKTSEEAKCSMSGNCSYSFTSTVPTVTTLEPEWDAATNTWTIKLSGTGFTGTAETSELTALGKV
jgi:hypothetical protein